MTLENNFVTNGVSQRKAAIISGASLVLMALAAAFSAGYVFSNTIVADDTTATISNIKDSLSLFRAGIVGWLLILILDVLVAWSLYHFFQQVNKSISLLAAVFRWIYSSILGVAICCLLLVPVVAANDSNILATPLIPFLIDSFNSIWSMGLLIFGLHLTALAYLALKANFVPKVFGILLTIAGISYVLVSALKIIVPEMSATIGTIEMILGLPMAAGELALAIWLWIKGGKQKAVTS